MKKLKFFLFLFLMMSVIEQVNALCVGCGCNRAFSSCMARGGCEISTGDGTVLYSSTQCCYDDRDRCHTCGGGALICVRLSAFPEPVNLEEVPPVYLNEIAHLMPIIKKYQRGQKLTEAEYAMLD